MDPTTPQQTASIPGNHNRVNFENIRSVHAMNPADLMIVIKFENSMNPLNRPDGCRSKTAETCSLKPKIQTHFKSELLQDGIQAA